ALREQRPLLLLREPVLRLPEERVNGH
ncbi:MAG: hypothetical protein QOI80_2127, partial [Solirubrobacteraceae bacterium]|nr:hypothetical protein [Solirubrobacteraceae bacterium]